MFYSSNLQKSLGLPFLDYKIVLESFLVYLLLNERNLEDKQISQNETFNFGEILRFEEIFSVWINWTALRLLTVKISLHG